MKRQMSHSSGKCKVNLGFLAAGLLRASSMPSLALSHTGRSHSLQLSYDQPLPWHHSLREGKEAEDQAGALCVAGSTPMGPRLWPMQVIPV